MALSALPFALLLLQGGPPATRPEPADLLVLGRLFTGELDAAPAEALAIRGDRIVAVGTRAEVERLRGSATRVLDAGERTVLPGFNDAHCHFTVAFGLDLGCDLSRATSLAEIQATLRAYAAAHPELSVIEGWGWDLADLPDGVPPHAGMLDEVTRERPIVLSSEGPHALWVSSAALERMKIPAEDPPGRRTLRDRDGRPSGLLLGRGLFGLAPQNPLPGLETIERGIRRGLEEALRAGVTTVHDPVSPFPARSLLDAGATLAFGTGCSLTPLAPFHGIRAAVLRQAPGGEPAGGWLPAERVSLAEALRAYTVGSAWAEGAQDSKGTLAPGRLADVVVLSADVFALAPERLLEVEVDATIVGGEVRWRRAR